MTLSYHILKHGKSHCKASDVGDTRRKPEAKLWEVFIGVGNTDYLIIKAGSLAWLKHENRFRYEVRLSCQDLAGQPEVDIAFNHSCRLVCWSRLRTQYV